MYVALFDISTGWIERVVDEGGYIIVALLILLENLIPPIPSEVILPLSGSFVASGQLLYPLVVLAATIGSVVGALIIYSIARYGGVPVIHRYGRYIGISWKDYQRGEKWFDRYDDYVVFFGRLLPGVRSIVSAPAGLAEMPIGRFLLLTTAGSAIWNAGLIGAGWVLGDNWREVAAFIEPLTPVILGVVLLLIAIGVFVLIRRRNKRQ